MRNIFLLMNVSLDGYFEAPNDDLSWTKSSYEAFSLEPRRAVDAFLFGRRTYEMMKAFWPTPQAAAMQPDVAKVMNETPKVVVSHHDFDPGWQNVTVISHNVMDEIRRLKAQPGESIGIFGSNTLCVSLMQERLIDDFVLLVNPVAIGEGTSLFQGLTQHVDFTLTKSHTFDSGIVMLTYAQVR
jgi:dihydrofolate reductase